MITIKDHDLNSFSVEVLQQGIFHVKIAPVDRKDFVSALDRYDFLEKLEEEKHVQTEKAEEKITVSIGGQVLELDASDKSVCLKDGCGKIFDLKEVRFSLKKAVAKISAIPDEDWVGFGDVSRETMWFRGHSIRCWLSNIKEYIASPFFMSTRGYAVLVNTTYPCEFDMAKAQPDSISITDESGVLNLYVFTGADFKELLRKYTFLTGRVQMIPVWGFGLWHICNNINNANDAVNDALNYRREKIPCDVIGLEPGWMERYYDYTTEKTWNKSRFPLMIDSFKFRRRTFIDAIKYGMGYHFELWICNDYDLTYEEDRRKGKLHHEESAEDFDANEYGDDLYPVKLDQATRDPKDPWFRHLENFVDWGADFFKQDAACQINAHPDRFYGNGMSDLECHNFYNLMYSRQMWEGFRNHTGKRPLIFTPVGWTGFQKWATTWTGDTGGGISTLCAMLNCAMLGHTLSTNDMSANTREGVHFGYLLPLSQINNFSSYRMPWLWGPDFIELHRYYSSLRSRLIPYLYSELWQTTQTGVPFLRPLPLEFQHDPACKNIRHEYLLGHGLLVTIFDRNITFPKGRWKDYWTGEIIVGGVQKEIQVPENRGGGLFVREGAIIPFGQVMQYRGEKPLDEIELYLFPGKKNSFDYYEDDGVSFEYQQGKYSVSHIEMEKKGIGCKLEINRGKKSRVRRWKIIIACDQKPESVVCNNAAIPFTWDDSRKELHAELPDQDRITVETV